MALDKKKFQALLPKAAQLGRISARADYAGIMSEDLRVPASRHRPSRRGVG